ncbi:MAG: glycoside hydrolase family 3 C-terminal domain-containing protein [Clostridia bacterium]|nr:glycoside hydrolase family 3 C-terminal domain-containing protein [Clostridia bacterium]
MKQKALLHRAVCLALCAIFVLSAFAGCNKNKGTTDRPDDPSSAPTSSPSSPTPPSADKVVSSGEDSGINIDKITPPVTNFTDDETFVKMTDIELTRYAGAEGMVLLKNDNNTLPLKSTDTVALFGEAQINFIKGGTGSGDVNALYVISALEGLKNKESEGKVKIYKDLADKYEANAKYSPKAADYTAAANAAKKAVVFISRNSGENVDVTPTNYYLTANEKALLSKVCAAGFEGITVVLNIGTVMDTSFMENYPGIDSLLVAWQPGMEGGNALADVLCGDVNPSGKLSDTMAHSYTDYPSSENFSSNLVYATYSEDIYVGYRYFETFDPNYEKVNYPFGFGLSYTTFDIGKPHVLCDGTYIQASVKVTNTGSVAGMEVVQLYFSAPQGKLGAPGKELAAFAKTKLLAPGESQVVTVCFAVTDMSRFDDTGKIKQYAYLMEQGTYSIYLGNSIKDANDRGVCYTYELKEDVVTEQLTDLLSEVTLAKRLLADGSYEQVYTGATSITLPEGKTVVSACDYLVQYNQTQLDANSSGDVYGMTETGGQSLIYTFTPPSAGTYTLSLGYCLAGKKTTENGFEIYLNGVKKGTLDLIGTGGKYTLGHTDTISLSFDEGVNKVEVKVATGVKESILLCTLTLDDGSGKGEKSLLAKTQKVVDPATEMSFLEVYEDPSKLDEFIDTLSPSEMIYLLCGHAPNVGHGDGSLAGLTAKDVPFVDTSDGPAGLDLAVKQVAWPIETALSCTWNTQLIYQVGQKIGEECYAAGVDVWLAPGINIHRDPLGGRNFEYFSEDPLLTGKMAAAITHGVQSVKGAGVMIKHLYANSRESYRVDGDSNISLRAAREIYLKAFEICVKEADPWSIMTTYNTANGQFNSENRELLTDILRGEWGFKGFVCTDWGAHSQQFREIAAGNDAKMSWGYPESTLAAYRAGALRHEDLRASAKRMLEIALKSGSLDRMLNPVIITHTIKADTTTRIKASELSSRSEGVGFEECLDEDGGTIPNYTQDGKRIGFNVVVEKTDTYGFTFRLSSNNRNSNFRIYVDGEPAAQFRWTEGSGGWQNWETVEAKFTEKLTKGEHVIEFEFGTAVNINWFEVTAK